MKEVKRPEEKELSFIKLDHLSTNEFKETSMFYKGHNQCHSKWEKYHDWVMEPIIKARNGDAIDAYVAIQESVRRSQR